MPNVLVAALNAALQRIRQSHRSRRTFGSCHTISIEYDPPQGNEVLWGIQSTTDPGVLPPGAVLIGGYLADNGIPTITRQVDPRSNASTISSPSFVFADIDGGVANDISRKFANFNTGRNAIVRYYVHPVDDLDLEDHLDSTFVMNAPRWYRGAMTISCADIQREASDADCMVPHKWRLAISVDSNAGQPGPPLAGLTQVSSVGEVSGTHLYLYGDTDPAAVAMEHSNAYPEQPGVTVLYVSIGEGETVAVTPGAKEQVSGVDVWKCPIVARGVFRTTPASVIVDQDGDSYTVDNLPEAEEVIYLNEPASSMLTAALTRGMPDGRVVPEHYFRGLDAFQETVNSDQELVDERLRWVDIGSLAGRDLGFPLVFRNPGKTKLMRFVEQQILGPMNGFLMPNRLGQLAFRPIPDLTPAAGYVGVLSDARNNIDTANVGELKLITDDRKDPIKVLSGWNWETETHRDQPSFYRPEVAEYVNNDVSELVLDYRGLATGYQGDPQRHELARQKAALHSLPVLEISVPSVLSRTQFDVGDVVRLETEKIRNSFSGLPYHVDMGRSFAVMRTTRDAVRGRVSYGLLGSTGTPGLVADSQREEHLPDSWYDQYPSLISSLSRTGGVQFSGGVLSGSGYTIAPGWYRIDDDLTIAPDFSCTFTGFGLMHVLCGKGAINIQAADPWNSKGMGAHAPGAGGTSLTFATAGDEGYVGGSRPGDAIDAAIRYTKGPELNSDGDFRVIRTSRARAQIRGPGITTGGKHIGAAPALTLAVNNGQLQGVPTDMAGSGGAGSGAHRYLTDSREGQVLPGSINTIGPNRSTVRNHAADGKAGGRGGIAIGYIARNIAFTGSGGTVCDGGNAGQAINDDFVGPPGQPGWPGVGFALVDGGIQKSLPDPSRFSCKVGGANARGIIVDDGDRMDVDSNGIPTAAYRSPDDPLEDVDLWESMTVVQHIPPPAQLREANPVVTDDANSFFATQRDGRLKLHIGPVRPSDSDLADMWITRPQLDADTLTPIAEIRDESGWRRFLWGQEPFEHVYASLIAYARRFESTEIIYAPERPANAPAGSIWIDSRTGAEWLLQDPPTPDILLRVPGVGPVGENLLSDLNMAGEGQGIDSYIFTRDGDLQPLSVLDIVVEQIRRAFIALGTLEGEYIDPTTTSGSGGTPSVVVPEPTNVSVTVLSPTSARLDWTAPLVQTYVDSYEIVVGNDFISGVTGSPYTVTGLTPDTLIFLGVQSKWNGPPETFSSSVGFNTAMPPDTNDPQVDLGITLSDTGRSVVGIARQNGSTTLIAQGRQIILTLNNGTQFFTNVGSGGAFTFNVPSGSDDQLGLSASLYTNNGNDTTAASLTFTYEV